MNSWKIKYTLAVWSDDVAERTYRGSYTFHQGEKYRLWDITNSQKSDVIIKIQSAEDARSALLSGLFYTSRDDLFDHEIFLPIEGYEEEIIVEDIEEYLDDTLFMETNDSGIRRIKSGWFYVTGIALLIFGIHLVSEGNFYGISLILTAFPCLLLYPFVRFLIGGKDSILGAFLTLIFEEVLKHKLISWAEDTEKKKRRKRGY